MNIQEIMSSPAVTCRSVDTLHRVARLMWDHDCGAIPVLNDTGRVIGMITDRDICMSAYMQGKCLDSIPVSSAMAKQVFSCYADDSVETAESLMQDKQVHRIPIVDHDKRPVGVLSLNDIARRAVAAHDKDGLKRKVIETLAVISQPRALAGAMQGTKRPSKAQQRHPAAV